MPLASYVHGYAQEKAKLVICSKEPEVLDDASLAVAYDVWPYLEDGQLVDFYINRLLDTVKAEKDAWLDRTWLDSTIDTMPDLIWYKDVKGAHLKVNDAFCNTVGRQRKISKDAVITIFGDSRKRSTKRANSFAWNLRKRPCRRVIHVFLMSKS